MQLTFGWNLDYDDYADDVDVQLVKEDYSRSFDELIAAAPFGQVIVRSADIDGEVELDTRELTPGIWWWRACVRDVILGLTSCSGIRSIYLRDSGQCADGIDNDGDGEIDFDDFACASGKSKSEKLKYLPRLSFSEARRYTRDVLRDDSRIGYDAGYGQRTKCRRVTKVRMRCADAWWVGDGLFVAHTRIWLRKCDNDEVCWYYKYKVTMLDDYCYSVQNRPYRSCVRRYRGG